MRVLSTSSTRLIGPLPLPKPQECPLVINRIKSVIGHLIQVLEKSKEFVVDAVLPRRYHGKYHDHAAVQDNTGEIELMLLSATF